MSILSWLVLGGLAGWVASIVVKKSSSLGLVGNVVVGIVGAFIGGYIFTFMGGSGITGFDIKSFFVALVGSIILLFLINLVKKGR